MTTGGIIPLSPSEKEPYRIVAVVRQLIEGRNNATGIVTLGTSVTSTTVSAPNCGPNSCVFLFQRTAHAAAILASTYVQTADITKGQFIVTHPSSANTDLTFSWVAFG